MIRTLFSALAGVAVFALIVLSLIPSDWIGGRKGYDSLGGMATAAGLAALALVGGWMWWSGRNVQESPDE